MRAGGCLSLTVSRSKLWDRPGPSWQCSSASKLADDSFLELPPCQDTEAWGSQLCLDSTPRQIPGKQPDMPHSAKPCWPGQPLDGSLCCSQHLVSPSSLYLIPLFVFFLSICFFSGATLCCVPLALHSGLTGGNIQVPGIKPQFS